MATLIKMGQRPGDLSAPLSGPPPVCTPAAVAAPVLGPPEVLDKAAAMAGPRAGKAPVGLHHLRAVPGGLVTKLPAELGQGRIGRSPAPRPRPRDPLLAQPAGGIQPLPHDPAVGGGQPGGEPRD